MHLLDIYNKLHVGTRVKRNIDERENMLAAEVSKIIEESDNIITFTAKGG